MERTGWLRVLYLEHYDADAAFRSLLEVIASHPPGLERDPLRILAEQSGLDRLRAQDGSPSGPDLLWEWVQICRRVGPHPLWQTGWGGAVPEIDTRVKVAMEAEWRPWERSRGTARRELLGLVAAELDERLARIEQAALDAGYVRVDKATKRREHLYWLFLHVRHRMTWTAIADLISLERVNAVGTDTVRKAVERIAPSVGVDISDR